MLSKTVMSMETSFYSCKQILTVGSGDASFEVALTRLGIRNLHVTFYDSEDEVLNKYGKYGAKNLKILQDLEIPLSFNVDATSLEYENFDLLIWNFPHNGHMNTEAGTIKTNQQLLRNVFRNSYKIASEIHISLGISKPYLFWEIETLAKGSHFRYIGRHRFCEDILAEGYIHRATKGSQVKVWSNIENSRVHRFRIMDEPWCKQFAIGKCKRGAKCTFLHEIKPSTVCNEV